MNAMNAQKIARLNDLYQAELTAQGEDQDTAAAMVAAAEKANLTLVRWYDQSGGLYQSADGLVFGWETGGFDDQVAEEVA